jgi:hypothetical protein
MHRCFYGIAFWKMGVWEVPRVAFVRFGVGYGYEYILDLAVRLPLCAEVKEVDTVN